MAPHSGILAWKIWWTEEPGGLQSMGSQRVTNACLHLLLIDVGFCPCLLLQTVLQEIPSCIFVVCLSRSLSRVQLQGYGMASASTPLPGGSVKVHYKEHKSLAHQDRKGFSIGY